MQVKVISCLNFLLVLICLCEGNLATKLECNLDPAVIAEIANYQDEVDTIIQYIVEGAYKGVTYDSLTTFADTTGPRMTGSSALEDAIDWIVSTATNEGFEQVYTEPVTAEKWVRNDESAELLSPRYQKLQMIGLGGSVGTPPEGITAPIIAVKTFDELLQVADQVPGKIVVYYQGFENYGQSVEYRSDGAAEAAKLGGVAALVMSVTPFSINSPHTGHMNYQEGVPQIPSAALSREDTGLLYRLYNAGENVTVRLTMRAENMGDITTYNTIIENQGYESPEQTVLLSGHIDSWDVGTGVMDDAGGCFISYHANVALRKLSLKARRTVSTVWFTGEELGVIGGKAYFDLHRNESSNYQLMMESDGGTFLALGLAFSGTDAASCVMQEILSLTSAINTTQLIIGADTPDLGNWAATGAPRGSLALAENNYFWYHHSNGDTIDVEDSGTLDVLTALWAAAAYVTADMTINLQTIT